MRRARAGGLITWVIDAHRRKETHLQRHPGVMAIAVTSLSPAGIISTTLPQVALEQYQV